MRYDHISSYTPLNKVNRDKVAQLVESIRILTLGRWCGVDGGICPNPPYEKRRDDCPLKPVEDKEVE